MTTAAEEVAPEAVETEEVEAEEETAPEAEPVLVPHRTAGRGLKIAAAAAASCSSRAAAFLGSTVQPLLANRATVADQTGHRTDGGERDQHAVDVHPGEHGLSR